MKWLVIVLLAASLTGCRLASRLPIIGGHDDESFTPVDYETTWTFGTKQEPRKTKKQLKREVDGK